MKKNQTKEFKIAQSKRMKEYWIERKANGNFSTFKRENNPYNNKTKFKIQSNIKIPIENPKYPFHLMKKGDSFAFKKQERKSIGINAYHYEKATGTKFKVHEKTTGECRIWKIK